MAIEIHTKACKQAGEVMRGMGGGLAESAGPTALKFGLTVRTKVALDAGKITRASHREALDAIASWVPTAEQVAAFWRGYNG